MDFGLSDEQQQLKASAREFLTNECPTTVVRKLMAEQDGMPRELYREIAKLGWTGLIVPEQFGGAGLSMLDMAVLLEESGYAAMPGPLLFSSTLAATTLMAGDSEELKRRWLPKIADGSAIGTIAIVEESDSISPLDLATTASGSGASATLTGVKMFVPYVQVAAFTIVAAGRGGKRPGSSAEVDFFVVENGGKGVKTATLQNLDLTRRVGRLELEGASATRIGGGSQFLERLINLGSVAIAADSLGGCERALEMAVEYSKVREQFGKPIGSFQALKHAAAEIVSELEPGRALLWYAAYAQDALAGEATRAASMAKARLCDAYSRGTDRAVLMHGGIGFTWEHDIHLWFKRARFNESFFGSPVLHRERLAANSGY